MRPFHYVRATSGFEAMRLAAGSATAGPMQYLAGGTTLLDLMKLDVLQPETLIDISGIPGPCGRIERRVNGVYLGALVNLADAARHPEITGNYPIIAQSLELAASQQIRNMATLGGNVLQRTRCNYYRDPSWSACNRRVRGSGCPALRGVNRKHAILGTSDLCIATYSGDLGQALAALDAVVEIAGPECNRLLPFGDLHRPPGDRPHLETNLEPGELITGFISPIAPWTRRSLYLKIRDRQSFEFALVSAAVALDLADDIVREARIALGGVATTPWRAREAEAVLKDKPLDESAAQRAAAVAFAPARLRSHNAFKAELGRRAVVRALLQAAQLRV
jgi:xanthine dehydrogenase YagS FAD-binding subunit